MSPSQQFVRHLIMDEVNRISCECPACKPPNPEWMLGTRFSGCERMARFLQLVRKFRELLDLSASKPAEAHAFAATPPAAPEPGGSHPTEGTS